MEKLYFKIQPNLFEISWPKKISEEVLIEQLELKSFLEKYFSDIILEIRIGFNTLCILFEIDIEKKHWESIWEKMISLNTQKSKLESTIWKIPVCYQEPFGFDLKKLAEAKNISESELIELHCSKPYRLHFYGFLPGFMYLGGLDAALHYPRKSNPDLVIPEGSVAIGGRQTGIYPMQSPGGWHIIGRTPLLLFDQSQEKPTIAKQGDFIQFESIDKEVFETISNQIQSGQYKWKHA